MEAVHKEGFKRQMRDFQNKMERAKEQWKKKEWRLMEKKKIEWKWESNWGDKYDGNYEGQVKDSRPHGLGKWKQDGGKWIVEGEWKDGQLNGMVVLSGVEYRAEYESMDGKVNGKCI